MDGSLRDMWLDRNAVLVGGAHYSWGARRAGSSGLFVSPSRGILVAVVHIFGWGLLFFEPVTVIAQATVSIDGGVDASGHNYHWSIVHDSRSPVVRIEIPHYMADLCLVPPGWEHELTHPNGSNGQSGVCVVTVVGGDGGLPAGDTIDIRMRVGPKGARRGAGQAIITFADGTEQVVTVAVPVKASLIERNVSLIGLGVMFVLFVIVRVFKARRQVGS